MNISRKWLREFVDITATDKEYDSVMTLAGQKVEPTERMDAEIKNVVVGRVCSMERHPNSDHMWICQVDVGKGEPVQIVTGAPNVTPASVGEICPVCLHKSTLPGGVKIEKGELRVSVLHSDAKWFGMTYHEDVAAVKDSFKKMLENGVYKADLFSDL